MSALVLAVVALVLVGTAWLYHAMYRSSPLQKCQREVRRQRRLVTRLDRIVSRVNSDTPLAHTDLDNPVGEATLPTSLPLADHEGA